MTTPSKSEDSGFNLEHSESGRLKYARIEVGGIYKSRKGTGIYEVEEIIIRSKYAHVILNSFSKPRAITMNVSQFHVQYEEVKFLVAASELNSNNN
jgi:hypothetical protein